MTWVDWYVNNEVYNMPLEEFIEKLRAKAAVLRDPVVSFSAYEEAYGSPTISLEITERV